MAEVRIFNPSSGYTPRSYFAGEVGTEGRTTVMAKHYKRRHHHRHHRHNPFGLSGTLIQDAAYNATGALGSLYLTNLVPQFSAGWTGVFGTGVAAVAMSYAGKMVAGARVSDELLKGGLTATIIKALHQMGVAQNLGLGLYSPSWFGIPTASDQYLRTAAPGMTFNRGAGSIYFPGPGGAPMLALPAAAAHMKGLGFHRFRSRYAGNY